MVSAMQLLSTITIMAAAELAVMEEAPKEGMLNAIPTTE
jgi:hypothetical protein